MLVALNARTSRPSSPRDDRREAHEAFVSCRELAWRCSIMTSSSEHPVITIDEDACTGCGLCVTECAEGAIEIVDGKARVVGEWLCDGIGHCVGACPAGALSVETRPTASSAAPSTGPGAAADAPTPTPASMSAPADPDTTAGREGGCVCTICGASETAATLVAIRSKGESGWCCTRCLPSLIHS
jgi:ferredoxin